MAATASVGKRLRRFHIAAIPRGNQELSDATKATFTLDSGKVTEVLTVEFSGRVLGLLEASAIGHCG
jgi:hypothetical protein